MFSPTVVTSYHRYILRMDLNILRFFLDSVIVLIQEPWINWSKILGWVPWDEVHPEAARVTVHIPAL